MSIPDSKNQPTRKMTIEKLPNHMLVPTDEGFVYVVDGFIKKGASRMDAYYMACEHFEQLGYKERFKCYQTYRRRYIILSKQELTKNREGSK